MTEEGLTSVEAAQRLTQYGPNEPVVVQRLSTLIQLLRLFANPLVIILLVASVISALLGQVSDAAIIATMVMLGVVINFWQSYQVIVKHLPAIQNLGSIDVLCSDKTGTLTAGVMQFDRTIDPAGGVSQRPLTLAWINSTLETGIRSPFDAAILQQSGADSTGFESA